MRRACLLSLALLAACQSAPVVPVAPVAPAPAPAAPPALVPAKIAVVQRRSERLPGFDRRLTVHVGDVTAGQVLVRVAVAGTATDVLPQCSMHIGDEARFEFEQQPCALVLLRMVNLLIGDDFVEFAVAAPGALERERIEAVLQHVADSGRTFERAGAKHDGSEAAELLRKQWLANDGVRTMDAFLQRVVGAGGSAMSWSVSLPGGGRMPLGEWLRGR